MLGRGKACTSSAAAQPPTPGCRAGRAGPGPASVDVAGPGAGSYAEAAAHWTPVHTLAADGQEPLLDDWSTRSVRPRAHSGRVERRPNGSTGRNGGDRTLVKVEVRPGLFVGLVEVGATSGPAPLIVGDAEFDGGGTGYSIFSWLAERDPAVCCWTEVRGGASGSPWATATGLIWYGTCPGLVWGSVVRRFCARPARHRRRAASGPELAAAGILRRGRRRRTSAGNQAVVGQPGLANPSPRNDAEPALNAMTSAASDLIFRPGQLQAAAHPSTDGHRRGARQGNDDAPTKVPGGCPGPPPGSPRRSACRSRG